MRWHFLARSMAWSSARASNGGYPLYNLLRIAIKLSPESSLKGSGFKTFSWWQGAVVEPPYLINFINCLQRLGIYQLIATFKRQAKIWIIRDLFCIFREGARDSL